MKLLKYLKEKNKIGRLEYIKKMLLTSTIGILLICLTLYLNPNPIATNSALLILALVFAIINGKHAMNRFSDIGISQIFVIPLFLLPVVNIILHIMLWTVPSNKLSNVKILQR